MFSKQKHQEREDALIESLKEYENEEELWMRKKKGHEELEAKEKKWKTKEHHCAEDIQTLLDVLKEDYSHEITRK